jgi:hypothetical protein
LRLSALDNSLDFGQFALEDLNLLNVVLILIGLEIIFLYSQQKLFLILLQIGQLQ